jgi:hypothetical protein
MRNTRTSEILIIGASGGIPTTTKVPLQAVIGSSDLKSGAAVSLCHVTKMKLIRHWIDCDAESEYIDVALGPCARRRMSPNIKSDTTKALNDGDQQAMPYQECFILK